MGIHRIADRHGAANLKENRGIPATVTVTRGFTSIEKGHLQAERPSSGIRYLCVHCDISALMQTDDAKEAEVPVRRTRRPAPAGRGCQPGTGRPGGAGPAGVVRIVMKMLAAERDFSQFCARAPATERPALARRRAGIPLRLGPPDHVHVISKWRTHGSQIKRNSLKLECYSKDVRTLQIMIIM